MESFIRERDQVVARLSALRLNLPPAPPPVGLYQGLKISGGLGFVSGRVSALRGVVGLDISEEEARAAARDTMLVLLAIVREDIGDLDRIISIECVRGFVRSAPDFVRQPNVIDAASELLIDLFGAEGRHARTATGASQLPYGAAVQLDMVVRLSPDRVRRTPSATAYETAPAWMQGRWT
jgi:enamine deaminase RidA (YjgF/YER057c/UK114 family)